MGAPDHNGNKNLLGISDMRKLRIAWVFTLLLFSVWLAIDAAAQKPKEGVPLSKAQWLDDNHYGTARIVNEVRHNLMLEETKFDPPPTNK